MVSRRCLVLWEVIIYIYWNIICFLYGWLFGAPPMPNDTIIFSTWYVYIYHQVFSSNGWLLGVPPMDVNNPNLWYGGYKLVQCRLLVPSSNLTWRASDFSVFSGLDCPASHVKWPARASVIPLYYTGCFVFAIPIYRQQNHYNHLPVGRLGTAHSNVHPGEW